MTSPPVDPVPSDDSLPETADAVVIGAGIIGASAALTLAEKGMRVALLEKGVVGGEQSSRNWGWCRQQGRDPREIPLIRASLADWDGLAERTGRDVGFARAGITWATDDPEQLAEWEGWVAEAERHGIDTRLLAKAELAAMYPEARAGWIGGLATPSDGRAEPAKAAPALAAAVRDRGGSVLTGCAVRGLEIEAGAVSAVVTERGPIRARRVLLAAGAWSNLFLKRHGLEFLQLNVRASVLRTAPAPAVAEGGLRGPGFALRRRGDGRYSVALAGASTFDLVPDALRYFRAFWPAYRAEEGVMKLRLGRRFLEALATRTDWPLDRPGPFEAARILDPEPDDRVLDSAMAELRRTFPALADLQVEQRWAGMIDATPDAVPVIGPVDKLPGLVIASGFSGHGFGLGPGAGRLAAELVAGAAPVVDPAPFRLARFTDGSRAVPDSAL